MINLIEILGINKNKIDLKLKIIDKITLVKKWINKLTKIFIIPSKIILLMI